ncbi:MAG: GABA-specific high-affinity permease [Vezdaea aestivalis]|nr:MAG: GABA-specific high-affinity permease [Vezdaea aestivalis]
MSHNSPSAEKRSSVIQDGVIFASGDDATILAQLGYKQELRRNFKPFEIFSIAFSIMGLLPSIATTISFSIPAGPAGMVWGWFTASGFIFVVGLALADLGSSMPTSGGLYWWTHYFASEKVRNPLSFLVGYSNTLGLIGGLVGIDYGFSLFLCSFVSIATDGAWTPSSGVVYGVFAACIICHMILASTLNRIMGRLQTIFVIVNFAVLAATVIALPIGKSRTSGRNPASYVFGHVENLTSWSTSWAFMLSFLSPIWTIGALDSCVHMSEEASNATRAVPRGIIMAVGCCWLFGFIAMIVIASCVNTDLSSVLDSKFGQPMAQIYFDALGKRVAMGMVALLFIVQFLMGLSIIVVASRQSWAFSRDGALPFSTFFRPISKKFGYIPLRTIWGCGVTAMVVGLLCLIAPAAASALFSLALASQNVSWLIPIMTRQVWGQKKFRPGPFYTGKHLSPILAWVAVIFLCFSTVLAMFPVQGPAPTPSSMNYSIVINFFVLGGSLVYYYIDARKWFVGPKTTLIVDGLSESQDLESIDKAGSNRETIAGQPLVKEG